MSTQVSTWPKGLYEADGATRAESAAGKGRTANRPLALASTLEHVPAIFFSAVFAAELAAVAVGLGILFASLATLVLAGAR